MRELDWLANQFMMEEGSMLKLDSVYAASPSNLRSLLDLATDLNRYRN